MKRKTKRPVVALTMDYSPAADERQINRGGDLYYINGDYIRYLEKANCIPLALPTFEPTTRTAFIIKAVDGLLLTGGDDVFSEAYGESSLTGDWRADAQRTYFEIELIREALQQNKPIFSICRGFQMLNVALGGTLYQDIAQQVPRAIEHRSLKRPNWNYHDIAIVKNSHLGRILGTKKITVTTSHHQAIKDLAPPLCTVAKSDDGVVEAVEMPEQNFVIGVQWHPETMSDQTSSLLLLQAFLHSCC